MRRVLPKAGVCLPSIAAHPTSWLPECRFLYLHNLLLREPRGQDNQVTEAPLGRGLLPRTPPSRREWHPARGKAPRFAEAKLQVPCDAMVGRPREATRQRCGGDPFRIPPVLPAPPPERAR